jgi:hypothetical protein
VHHQEAPMSGKDVTTELPVEIGDPLAAKIRDSILGVDRGAVLGQFLPRRGTLPIPCKTKCRHVEWGVRVYVGSIFAYLARRPPNRLRIEPSAPQGSGLGTICDVIGSFSGGPRRMCCNRSVVISWPWLAQKWQQRCHRLAYRRTNTPKQTHAALGVAASVLSSQATDLSVHRGAALEI